LEDKSLARQDIVTERLQQIKDGERTADGKLVRGFVGKIPVGSGDGVAMNFMRRVRQPLVYSCNRVVGVGDDGQSVLCNGDVLNGVCCRKGCKDPRRPLASEPSASSNSSESD
jgi:hypothetical protein